MELTQTQQKLRDSMDEFLKKENCQFMFIRPPKGHFGLSYTLLQFMLAFEGEQILYLTDTQSQAKSMQQDFEHHLLERGREFVSNETKTVCGKGNFRFDFIDSPRLRGLPKNTFFICRIQKEHSLLEAIRESPEKSIWIIHDNEQWQSILNQKNACFFTILSGHNSFGEGATRKGIGYFFNFSSDLSLHGDDV